MNLVLEVLKLYQLPVSLGPPDPGLKCGIVTTDLLLQSTIKPRILTSDPWYDYYLYCDLYFDFELVNGDWVFTCPKLKRHIVPVRFEPNKELLFRMEDLCYAIPTKFNYRRFK